MLVALGISGNSHSEIANLRWEKGIGFNFNWFSFDFDLDSHDAGLSHELMNECLKSSQRENSALYALGDRKYCVGCDGSIGQRGLTQSSQDQRQGSSS